MNIQLILSLSVGVIVSCLAGYLGTLMLSRRMSVVAGPLAHLAFPGAAIALMFNFSLALGVFPFVIMGALLIWYINHKTRLPMENLSAVIFAIGVGGSLLFLPIGKAQAALIGSIMSITSIEAIFMLLVSLMLLFIVRIVYEKILLISIYEDLAKVQNINVPLYNLIYLLIISITIAMSVYLVGGLITAALIAIPAGSSRNLSGSLRQHIYLATIFGFIGTGAGIVISYYTSLPTGPLIVVSHAVIFIFSLLWRAISSK